MLAAMAEPPLLLALDLAGTFAFALNGAITGLEAAQLDIVGMLTLGMVTALGGGILRDILINALPPATFSSWPYLAVAAGGALIAFFLSRQLRRFTLPIDLLDAAGLSLFCVTGATKSLEYGLGPAQAVILGAVTAVGGGTIRDVLVRRVPTVLTSGLYAIPALIGAAIAVTAVRTGVYGVPAALGAALACFLIRLRASATTSTPPSHPRPRKKSDHTERPVPAVPNPRFLDPDERQASSAPATSERLAATTAPAAGAQLRHPVRDPAFTPRSTCASRSSRSPRPVITEPRAAACIGSHFLTPRRRHFRHSRR